MSYLELLPFNIQQQLNQCIGTSEFEWELKLSLDDSINHNTLYLIRVEDLENKTNVPKDIINQIKNYDDYYLQFIQKNKNNFLLGYYFKNHEYFEYDLVKWNIYGVGTMPNDTLRDEKGTILGNTKLQLYC